jgi:hypothetical protein
MTMRCCTQALRLLGLSLLALGVSAKAQVSADAADGALPAGATTTREHPKPVREHDRRDSPGKPQAPIDVRYELLGVPTPGQPLPIRLSLSTPPDVHELGLDIRGGERVQVPAAAASQRLERAGDEARYEVTVTVVPLAAGPSALDLVLTAVVGGRLQSRLVSIPIQFGKESARAESARKVSIDASGRAIISLPAER